MMKILHLFPDDAKFLGYAKDFFLLPQIENTWFVIGNREDEKLPLYPNHFESYDSIFDAHNLEVFQTLIEQHDLWFIHYFDSRLIPVVNRFASQKPLIIQLWGGDYARFTYSTPSLIEEETYRITIHANSKTKYLPIGLSRLYHRLKWKLGQGKRAYFSSMSRASEIWTLLHEEEVNLFKNWPDLSFSEHKVIYGEFSEEEISVGQGIPKILLGNSGNSSNNHLEVIQLLNPLKEQFDHCYLPMSYAGTDEYRKDLAQSIPSNIYSQVSILQEMMPKETYFRLVNECDVIIMNHIRQQALGNILYGLCRGKTIYLNPKGVLWKYFFNRGYAIKKTSNLRKQGLQKVSLKEAQLNQRLVLRSWSRSENAVLIHLQNAVKG